MGTRGRKSAAERELGELAAQPMRANVETGDPPRPLGAHGTALWARLTGGSYAIPDAGTVEQIANACAMLDRAEACREQIEADGVLLEGRAHPLLRDELGARAFVAKTLQRLKLKSNGGPLPWEEH